jgi:hypothetical protein
MNIHVFLGPTLPHYEAADIVEATYLPPVAQGDVARSCLAKPDAIAIIDGYFESVPAVWHKEILFALTQGIPVYGASSMGALRAAELHPFGMIGIGAIFEAYRDGRIEDDDEVAVIHGPAELGYPSLSEAMVNIRRTLAEAMSDDVIDVPTGRLLENIAKELPYRERGYGRMLRLARESGVAAEDCARFEAWLPNGRVDQKREDARLLLNRLKREAVGARIQPRFRFEHTLLWENATRALASGN